MRDAPRGLALPRGFRDILPTEARELHAIQRLLMSTFASYGYVPLEPPTVELAPPAIDERRLLRFVDRDGRLLALRPDVTTAVARVVAQRYRDVEGALRLSYFTPIFREEASMRGSEREYDQAGIELIGMPGALGDVEAIAVLADALQRCGLPAAEVDIGHVGFLRGFLGDLPETARVSAEEAARHGDLVSVLGAARNGGLSAQRCEALDRGLRYRGPGEFTDVRRDAPSQAQAALKELEALQPLLDAAGVGAAVRFDLGFMPALSYYTGIVFQVTAPGLGFAVAAGGRYDGFLARFGADLPATGFGIAVPHLHQAVVADGWNVADDPPLVVLLPAEDDVATIQVATALRRAGLAVAVGDVAETAGRPTLRARAVDETHVEYESVVRALDAFVAVLTGTPP
ncbi:MAG: ATP phosphoribosyltransferase regulatory subunit [Candidatus Limnocylindria bacterium]